MSEENDELNIQIQLVEPTRRTNRRLKFLETFNWLPAGPINIQELCERMHLNHWQISSYLAWLKREGLVTLQAKYVYKKDRGTFWERTWTKV